MISLPSTALALDWDLSDLYQGFDDLQFIQDLATVQQRAYEFRVAYRGRVAQLTPEEVATAFRELEAIAMQSDRLYYYPMLRFSADTRDSEAQQKLDQVQEVTTEVENQVLFFDLELQQLSPDQFTTFKKHQALENYSRYLDYLVELQSYQLAEDVEQVLNQTSLTGREAWIQLRDLHLGSQIYPAVTDSEGKTATTEAELAALLFHPGPQVRLDAYRSVRQVLATHNVLYGYILNTLAQDHRLDAARRRYSSTLAKQLLAYEMSTSVFEAVMESTRARYDLFQRYYRLKERAIGHSIRICDLYAPWINADTEIAYADGVAVLIQALHNFSPEYAEQAQEFFRHRWVDVQVRPGKRRGGFCAYVGGLHSYLMLSYTNDYNSLFTLAHELGHGLHCMQIQKQQSYFNSDPPIVLAEIASVFNEFLLLDYLLKQNLDSKLSQALLTQQLENQLNLLFRQSAISRLELVIHQRATQGSFDHEFINEEWFKIYEELCGDVIELLHEHRYDWAKMEHIFMQPFYCYNYTLSFIVALACYQQYQNQGKDFVPHYLNLLELGNSRTPQQALQTVGIDLASSVAISQVFTTIEILLNQLEDLLD
jgi:oligoendopeptidase F